MAASEIDVPVESLDEEAVMRMYDSLCLVHLPVLLRYDAVEFDYRRGVIRSTDRTREFLDVLEESRNDRQNWFLAYTIPAVGIAAVVLGLDSVAGSPDSVLASVTLVGATTLLLVPLLHYVTTRSRAGVFTDTNIEK